MTEHEAEGTEGPKEDRVQEDPAERGPLEQEQRGKGYGHDEGERDGALPS